MAHIEINALSVCLAGTFEAEVFYPEIDLLDSQDSFPVLWMIHEDGSSPKDLVRYASVMEKIANEKKIFIIAPTVGHSLATNMSYGTDNEEFLGKECIEIFRFLYPLSAKKEDNYIFGIHTGAYGAVKLAMKYPNTFGTCFTVNGELDIVKRLDDLNNKNAGFIHQTAESLIAVFGESFIEQGRMEDLYFLATKSDARIYLFCSKYITTCEDNCRLADIGATITIELEDATDDYKAIQDLLEKAIRTCMKGM